jgi:hypothetical protein
MMRACDSDHRRLILPLIRFPQERITFLRPPLPGWLPAFDFEVQMRPTAAAAFLTQQADAVSLRGNSAGNDALVNLVEVAVTVVPASAVQQINYVVTR